MAVQPKTLYLPDRQGRSRTFPVPLDWGIVERGQIVYTDRYWDARTEKWSQVAEALITACVDLDASAFRALIRRNP